MAMKLHNTLQHYDYILDKPSKKLEVIEKTSDDGGGGLPASVDSFLSSVLEAYGMVGEMTSADKQQVSLRLAAVKEMSAQCSHEMIGGAFDGMKWKSIARSVMETLIQSVDESRRTQMLRQLQLCEHNLSGIQKCGFIEIIVTEFKRLLINCARLLEYVYKYLSWGTLNGQNTQNVLLLCASQLQKLFPLLLRALEVTDHPSEQRSELKNYIAKRMELCLSRIKKIIEGSGSEVVDEGDDLGGGLFITHMDQALSLLAMFDTASEQNNVSGQWRSSVEALLQHAMSIAQIASQFDFKMIHASGEKILRLCQNLEEEKKSVSSNPSVCKLHASSLSNALEELEQRVCASVLKMYLQAFSAPFAPLQALCSLCWSKPKEGEIRKADDLSDAISSFDNHTDRIIQVAVFAIACSEDQSRVLGIRSCLASLESLETHLVPALSTFYLKQVPSHHLLIRILVEHWNSEVKLLWQLIDGIVDPAALAQVTHNVIWAPTAIIKKSIMANKTLQKSELTKLVSSVVANASVFSNQLQVSVEEMCLSSQPKVSHALKELLLAVREGRAVLQKIEGSDTSLSVDRILKRCELLVSCVGHIQPLLEDLDNPMPDNCSHQMQEHVSLLHSDSEDKMIDIPSKKQKNHNKQLLCLGLPIDADIEIDTTDAGAPNELMQSLMDKTSVQHRFMTSFLYNEKKTFSTLLGNSTPRYTGSSHVFSRKTMDSQDHLLQHTFSLDVSKLAGLSETLRHQSNFVQRPLSPSLKKLQLSESDTEEVDSSKDISTPERMKDLMQVQNKIDSVKKSSQHYDPPLFNLPISQHVLKISHCFSDDI